ncbi:MAG: hypothetical protein AB1489_03575 [Acidobacteriota bacterium]
MPSVNKLVLDIVVMETLNYYNYFTEVEEAFVSRRGAPMWISPLDWALVQSWKDMGIPLHIVLRGINKSFEGADELSRRGKRVNTLFYCQQEVISNFKDYVESQVGASNNGTAKNTSEAALFPKQEVVNFISMRREELTQARVHAFEVGYGNLTEALWRAISRLADIISELNRTNGINAEALERDLTLLENMIYESLRSDISTEELEEISAEADQQLRPHKKRMEPEIYQQTRENYIAKRLREMHFIPRLSLFYML